MNHGSSSPSFKIQSDLSDVAIPGRHKQDSAWGHQNRPDLTLPNPYTALIPRQSIEAPFPTLILEVGNSQPILDLLKIRDMSLSWKTAINIFVLIAYDIIDRNATPASDTWYMQVAVCDFHAPVQKYQMASVEG